MRLNALVSESAQCTTTSCADHSPGFGRHCVAAAGTLASAAFSRAGPAAYSAMRLSLSSRVIHRSSPEVAEPPWGAWGARRGPPSSTSLEQAGGALAAADAHRHHAVARLAPLHLV